MSAPSLPVTILDSDGRFLARLHAGHGLDRDVLEQDARDTCLPRADYPLIVAEERQMAALYRDWCERCAAIPCRGRSPRSHWRAALTHPSPRELPGSGTEPVTLVRVAELAEITPLPRAQEAAA